VSAQAIMPLDPARPHHNNLAIPITSNSGGELAAVGQVNPMMGKPYSVEAIRLDLAGPWEDAI
jgi:hypothetical protein